MSRGYPSMTALLGLLAIAGVRPVAKAALAGYSARLPEVRGVRVREAF
jgi:hypothetical protein